MKPLKVVKIIMKIPFYYQAMSGPLNLEASLPTLESEYNSPNLFARSDNLAMNVARFSHSASCTFQLRNRALSGTLFNARTALNNVKVLFYLL